MAIKDFCSLKTYPSFFFAQRSLPAVQSARRNIETDKWSQTLEHTGRRRARFSSGCTSLPLLCSCLLADVRYLQAATQLTALLATCCWLSCVHAGQVFAQTQAKTNTLIPVFPDHPCPMKIHNCLMTTDLSDTHLGS